MEDSSHVREAEQAPLEGNIPIKIEQADYSITISKTRKKNGFQIKLSEVRPEKNITFLHESDMDKITTKIKSLGDCDTIDELIKTFATMIAKGNPSVIKKDEQYYLAFEVIILLKKRTYELDLEKHEPVNQIATIQKDIADIKQQLDKYKAISEELLKKVNANENTNYKEYVDKTIEEKLNALEHKFTQDLKTVDDTYNNTIANTKNELLERINGININGHPATKEPLKELNKTKQKHSDEEQIIHNLIQEVNTLKDDNNKKDTTITQITKEINNLIKEVNTLKTDNNKKDTTITQTNNEIKELKQKINKKPKSNKTNNNKLTVVKKDDLKFATNDNLTKNKNIIKNNTKELHIDNQILYKEKNYCTKIIKNKIKQVKKTTINNDNKSNNNENDYHIKVVHKKIF